MLEWSIDDPIGFYVAYERAEPGASEPWLGWFHLKPSIDPAEGALELGYRLRRAAWGRGLATEGARALAALAVDELDVRWLDGCAMPDNLASIAVLKKCGLSYVDRRLHPRVSIEVAFYRAAPGAIVRG
jgi:RimJ/RimL family protein N-acetyltransferase